MKKILPLILIFLFLTSCSLPFSQPKISDSQLATEVSKVLTSMPTETAGPVVPTSTPIVESPSMAVATTTAPPPPPPPPIPTPTVEPPPPTPQPTVTEIPTLIPTLEPTELPTVTPTVVAVALIPTAATTLLASIPVSEDDPRDNLGPPTSADPMDDGKLWTWPTGWDKDGYTAATFRDGSFLLTGLKPKAGWRLPMTPAMADAYVEGVFRISKCTGKDNAGIIFRIPEFKHPEEGYVFAVSCDGNYRLWEWDGTVEPDGKFTSLIPWKASPMIRKGPDQPNRLGVMTIGHHIALYINGTKVNEITDNTYQAGYFGVMVAAKETKNLTVRVDEMAYWLQPHPQY